jgi:uncharacterized DUF497 family protein
MLIQVILVSCTFHRYMFPGTQVVYTWRGETIRIISACKATKREQRHYEVGL